MFCFHVLVNASEVEIESKQRTGRFPPLRQ